MIQAAMLELSQPMSHSDGYDMVRQALLVGMQMVNTSVAARRKKTATCRMGLCFIAVPCTGSLDRNSECEDSES